MYGNKMILVVDDNPYILSFLKNLLSKNGFKVIIQHGGREALEFLLESQNIEIKLIITDDTDGYKVFDKILHKPDTSDRIIKEIKRLCEKSKI